MKIVHFSDLHLDTPFSWMGVSGSLARERRNAQRKVLERVTRIVIEEQADALFCGGDLYEHDLFTPDTGTFLRKLFAHLDPLPVFLAPGNHDWFGPGSLYATLDWSPNVHIFNEDSLTPVMLTDGLTLWGAGHRSPANTDGFLEHFRVDRSGTHLALFHGAEMGSLQFEGSDKKPHAPFREHQITASGLHHVFAGHYHRARQTALLTYPGNPDPLAFGEDGGRGVVIATIETMGVVSREIRNVAETTIADVSVDLTDASSRSDVLAAVEGALQQCTGVIRVFLTGELAPEVDLRLVDFDALSLPGIEAIQFQVRVKNAYDLDSIAREKTVRGEFVREVRRAGLPSETERRVLVTGLRALAGRRDLEVL